MNRNRTARWGGEMIAPDADIPLNEGWNMVAYFPNYTLSAAAPDFHAVSSIIDNLIIAKDGFGNFMIPEHNFSNMPPLRRARGYQLKVDAELVLNYPGEREGVMMAQYIPVDKKRAPVQTNENMSVLITGINLVPGEVITAYSTDDLVVGYGEVDTDGRCGLALWGDDPTSETVDGLITSESFAFRTADYSNLTVENIQIGGELVYQSDNFLAIELIKSGVVPSEYNLHNIYPNPFNSTVQIRYSVPLISRVSLKVYDVTGSLIEEIVSDVRSAGLHSVTWNALNVASGIYFVRMEAAEFSQTTKVMLIK
jgi:hypothetical protein